MIKGANFSGEISGKSIDFARKVWILGEIYVFWGRFRPESPSVWSLGKGKRRDAAV